MLNHKSKSDKSKFLESCPPALTPKGCEQCNALPYDLYSSSTLLDDEDYVCLYYRYRKVCTTKDFLNFRLQHHSYADTEIGVEDDEVVYEQNLDTEDSSCVIQSAFMSKTWEIV